MASDTTKKKTNKKTETEVNSKKTSNAKTSTKKATTSNSKSVTKKENTTKKGTTAKKSTTSKSTNKNGKTTNKKDVQSKSVTPEKKAGKANKSTTTEKKSTVKKTVSNSDTKPKKNKNGKNVRTVKESKVKEEKAVLVPDIDFDKTEEIVEVKESEVIVPDIDYIELEDEKIDIHSKRIIEESEVEHDDLLSELRVDEKTEEIKIVEPKVKSSNKEITPKTILGIELPTGKSISDKKERKKFYLKDALIFAIIVPVLDFFAMLFIDSYTYMMITNSVPLNYLITILIDFVLIFVVTYIIDYIFGEDAVKRINK